MSAMARSHVARHHPRRVPATKLVWRLARAAIATAAVAAAAVAPLLDGAAHASPAAPGSPTSPGSAASAPLTLSVTSLSPSYAREGGTLVIEGQASNDSSAAVSNLSVRLYSASAPLRSRLYLESFAQGTYLPPGESPVATTPVTLRRLASGRSWHWHVRLPVGALRLSCYGVYPLTVQVSDAALQIGSEQVPLPYWPTKGSTCPAQRRPVRFAISWIWPLIDTPRQGACPGLLDNGLAASLASGGRLRDLLGAGARFATKAGLTWAIDPALLDNAAKMSHQYLVGSAASCGKTKRYPASSDARTWLATLRHATKGQPVFVTPYADVDVAALAGDGGPDLRLAFVDGDQIAHQVLGRDVIPANLPASGRKLAAMAWPADGIASPGLLETLAALNIGTVVLTMPALSPVSYTPGAVTTELTGIGKWLHVLLADHGLAGLLASSDASSRNAGAIFKVRQLFLAQTAMIGAEAPGKPRPVVVTPPRRWNPAMALAYGLLADTAHAPWLRPSTAGQLISMHQEKLYKPLPQFRSRRQLPARLLRQVARCDRKVALLESIRVRPDPVLHRAVFGIESSAWRAGRTRHAKAMLTRTDQFVESQLRGLSIESGGKKHKLYVTSGGKVSSVHVLIHNGLGYPVKVGLTVRASNATVQGQQRSVTIPARSYSAPVRLTVLVPGSTPGRIRLGLTSPHGTSLPFGQLTIQVHPTDFGTFALVICAAALAVFVAASAARAIRHGRPAPPSDPTSPDAGPPDSADPPDRPEYPDSVFPDPPDMPSAGPAILAQERAAPSGRSTEERR